MTIGKSYHHQAPSAIVMKQANQPLVIGGLYFHWFSGRVVEFVGTEGPRHLVRPKGSGKVEAVSLIVSRIPRLELEERKRFWEELQGDEK